MFQKFRFGILIYIASIIGVILNTLAIVVLSKHSLREVFHELLIALAVFDNGYLLLRCLYKANK